MFKKINIAYVFKGVLRLAVCNYSWNLGGSLWIFNKFQL